MKMWPFRKRRPTQLDRIEDLLQQLLEGQDISMSQIDDVITALNTNTNAVAARLDQMIAEIAADKASTVSAAQLASLTAISDHLKTLGSDPAAPVPTPPPAAVASPDPAAPAA